MTEAHEKQKLKAKRETYRECGIPKVFWDRKFGSCGQGGMDAVDWLNKPVCFNRMMGDGQGLTLYGDSLTADAIGAVIAKTLLMNNIPVQYLSLKDIFIAFHRNDLSEEAFGIREKLKSPVVVIIDFYSEADEEPAFPRDTRETVSRLLESRMYSAEPVIVCTSRIPAKEDTHPHWCSSKLITQLSRKNQPVYVPAAETDI